jgi:S-formylglutathione hydrolase FrmB
MKHIVLPLQVVYLLVLIAFSSYSTMAQNIFAIASSKLPRQDSVLVVVPDDYVSDTTKSYKTIFMLHGWSGNFRQWSGIINLQEYANRYDFILVCPDGLYDSWYVNSPAHHNQRYADYFFDDLYPTITKKYRVNTQQVFITGLSMGGYGAYSLFLAQPKLFRGVAATSALFDIRKFPKRFGLPKIFGGYDSAKWSNYCIVERIKSWESKDKVLYFDCGKNDLFFPNNKEMFEVCQELGIKAVFKEQDGVHNKKYWSKAILQHFEFFAQQ